MNYRLIIRSIGVAGISIVLAFIFNFIQDTGVLSSASLHQNATIGKGIGIFLLLSAGYSIWKDRMFQKKNEQSQ